MSESREPDGDKMPDDEQLQKPSTEKEPAEEPKDPDLGTEEPSHRAVGIGVFYEPPAEAADDSSTEGATPAHPTAAETARADDDPPTDAATDEVRRAAAGLDDSEDSRA